MPVTEASGSGSIGALNETEDVFDVTAASVGYPSGELDTEGSEELMIPQTLVIQISSVNSYNSCLL